MRRLVSRLERGMDATQRRLKTNSQQNIGRVKIGKYRLYSETGQLLLLTTNKRVYEKAKMSLVKNINKRKKNGTRRSKKDSTVSPKAYADMKAGWPKSGKSKAKKASKKS